MNRPRTHPPTARLDHLVLAVPDLEAAAAEIHRDWGCEVRPGGRHPRWGSWNALVPLRGAAYLEIIAPHPIAPEQGPRVFGLDEVALPVLVAWAVRPVGEGAGEMETMAGAVRKAGVELGSLLDGSRRTPDGRLLSWRLSDPFARRMDGVVPFVIHWGDTPHPSGAGRAEVTPESMEAGHPEGARLSRALSALGASGICQTTAAEAPVLRATLSTPRGRVTLIGPAAGGSGISSTPP